MENFSKANTDITFHLSEVMKKKNYSKTRLCREANLRFEVELIYMY